MAIRLSDVSESSSRMPPALKQILATDRPV
jgi:hypothetical protein